MILTRREFAGAGAALTMVSLAPGAAEGAKPVAASWQSQVRRCGQLNFNETDPLTIDVEAWMDLWAAMKVDCAVIGFGGVMATYPTKVPFHRPSQYLNGRDLTGEAVRAARKRGIRVIARIDCNYAYQDALEAHPDWFMRRKDGSLRTMAEANYLFKTCQFGPFFSEQMPAILREMNALYAPDAVFANGWPGTAAIEMCYCVNCQKIYRERTDGVPPDTTDIRSPQYRRFHRVYMERIVQIWQDWTKVLQERARDAFFFGDLGGANLQMIKDLAPIGEISAWYAGDHQGRSGNRPIWDCAAQGRIAKSVMGDKVVSNFAAAYSYNAPRFRHAASPPAELDLWLAQTTAAGIVPWAHWLGGAVRDRRWEEPTSRFFTWMAAHDPHFRTRRSLANVAVLYPQSTIAFYRSAGVAERTLNGGPIDPEDYLQGLYYSLLDERIPFDLVHQERLSAAALKPYKALLIPNAALLRDSEIAAIRSYVAGGGSILATFETSRYNEYGDQRSDFGLQDMFGVTYAGDFPGGVIGPFDNSYAEIRQRHPAFKGFEQTEILPGAQYRVPVAQFGRAPLQLTNVPHYTNAMPELIYPRTPHTDDPAAVFREVGASRIAYFAGDVDRMAWTNGNPDFSRLIGNTVRWLMGDTPLAVNVTGPGLIEVFPWKTDGGHALHIVNYTTPNALRPFVRDVAAIGPLEVDVAIPAGTTVSRVRTLRSARELAFRSEGGRVTFTVPTMGTYEVVAIE